MGGCVQGPQSDQGCPSLHAQGPRTGRPRRAGRLPGTPISHDQSLSQLQNKIVSSRLSLALIIFHITQFNWVQNLP